MCDCMKDGCDRDVLVLALYPSTTGASSSEARCQQATTCRRRGVAYLRRAPAPCAVGVGCGAAPPLAGWLLAAWLPACVTVTEYRIDAGSKIADESITSDVRWITSSKLQTSRSRRQNLRNTRLVSREFHLCQSQDSER